MLLERKAGQTLNPPEGAKLPHLDEDQQKIVDYLISPAEAKLKSLRVQVFKDNVETLNETLIENDGAVPTNLIRQTKKLQQRNREIPGYAEEERELYDKVLTDYIETFRKLVYFPRYNYKAFPNRLYYPERQRKRMLVQGLMEVENHVEKKSQQSQTPTNK